MLNKTNPPRPGTGSPVTGKPDAGRQFKEKPAGNLHIRFKRDMEKIIRLRLARSFIKK